jgi:sugar lactone lactonase YvrE
MFLADQIIVRSKDDITEAALRAELELEGMFLDKKITNNLYTVRLASADLESVPKALHFFTTHPDLAVATTPDGVGFGTGTPNDIRFGEQWALNNTGQDGGSKDTDVNGSEFFDLAGNTSVVIAVLDSGINSTHPDLQSVAFINPNEIKDDNRDNDKNGKIDDISGWNFVGNDNAPVDDNGHGSHVAGIIAAARNNFQGVAGMLSGARLLCCKVLNGQKSGLVSDLIAAVAYSREFNVPVMNLSLGDYPENNLLAEEFTKCEAANIVLVISAGSQGTDNDLTPNYPSSYPHKNIIAVGNHNRNDVIHRGSNYPSNYGKKSVHIFAPGAEVLSTTLGSSYENYWGSSMAAPFVAATCGAMKAKAPLWSAPDIRKRILASATLNKAYANSCVSGGRLDAYKSLSELPPAILKQPTPIATTTGNQAVFTITAVSSLPLTYQWRKNGLPLDGGSSAILTIANAQLTNTGTYDCILNNNAGTISSDTATLTVIPPPPTPAVITKQPASVASYPGVNATFRVQTSGTPAPSYQWRKNGADIPGATNSSYTISSVGSLSTGTYDVVVTNPLATLTSNPASLTLKPLISGVGNWSTLAGSPGGPGYADGSGTAARVNGPGALVRDGAGNIFIADRFNHVIRKMSPAGVLSTYAGVPQSSGSVDGAAATAKFNEPTGLALDSTGNLFVADTKNFKIRKISTSGQVSTLAGSGAQGNADGAGTTAMFDLPERIVVDAGGNLYVSQNEVIRKITPTGTVSTLAGVYGSRGSANGTGPAAQFQGIADLTLDASGNVIVFDQDNSLIRKITPAGIVSTLLGTGTPGYLDGPKATAKLQQPRAGVFDANGNLYFIDAYSGRIRKLGTDGNVSTVAGNGTLGETDGPIATASLRSPNAIVMEAGGTFLISDGDLLRRVTPTGTVSTLVGIGVTGTADGTGSTARFGGPFAIATSASGDAYVSDYVSGNVNSVRKITRDGRVTTLAGGFIKIRGLAVDKNANVYVTVDGLVVKKIQPSGTVTTFAGSGTTGFADGSAATASFGRATGLAFDGAGNLFVADPGNYAIRKIDQNGAVSTLAGGAQGTLNGTGRAAQFQGIAGITADTAGNVFVFETSGTTGNRIRKITSSGEVSTVATGFSSGYAMAVDSAGNLYTSCDYAHVLQKSAPTGTASQFAGIRNVRGSTDGPADVATFNFPHGLAFNPDGNLLVVDWGNCRIRLGTFTDVQPVFSAQPASQAATFGNAVTFTAAASGSPPFSYQWRKGGVEIPGATAATYSLPSVQLTDADTYDVIIANGAGAIVSTAATLTVSPPQNSSLVITGQPQSTTVLVGQSASFRATATGLSPIQFQWRKGGININGATFAAYNLSSTQLSDTGSYDVVITNPGGSVISSPALLTVNPPPLAAPKITVQPAPVASYTGLSATFAVTATGNPAPAYQWRKNGVTIPNATGESYTIASVGPLDAGSYSVVASNSQGSVTSNAAVLTTKTIVPQKGNWRVLAGAPGGQDYADGTGSAARFDEPNGLTFDAQGNLFVAGSGDRTIRKITPSGVATTVYGTPYSLYYSPRAVAFDPAGTMYAALWTLNPGYGLCKFDAAGKRTDIPIPAKESNGFNSIAIDSAGTIYCVDGSAIWKISPSGAASIFAGSLTTSGTLDGTGGVARFTRPSHMALDTKNNLYVAASKVRIVSPSGVVTTLPGDYEPAVAVAVDSLGNVWTASYRCVQKITPSGQVTTIAGDKDTEGCTDGPGTTASFSWLQGIALDKAGNVFVADQGVNHTIRKITPEGMVSTFLGASPMGSADGQGTNARFFKPRKIAVDATGNAFVTDQGNNTIRKITPGGTVTTVAGSPRMRASTDGVGSTARFSEPEAIAVDQANCLYVTEQWGSNIRKILPSGAVSTVATGAANKFGRLTGIVVDSSGTIFVSDYSYSVIRKISPSGQASIFAGNGKMESVDGVGTAAAFSKPGGLRFTNDGSLLVGSQYQYIDTIGPGEANCKLRRILPSGAVSTLVTIPDPGTNLHTNDVVTLSDGSFYLAMPVFLFTVTPDGKWTSTRYGNHNNMTGMALDPNGNLLFVDPDGCKIWTATLADVPLKITSQPSATVVDRGTAATFTVGATGSGPISYQWRRNGVEIPGATLPSLGIAQAQAADAGSYDVVLANGAGAVVSTAAELSVVIPPDAPVAITTQPVGGSVYLGSYVSFSIQTTGTLPITYQWRKDGYDIPGATGATYSIAYATVANSGTYEVSASNVLGTVTSTQATLSVSPFATNPILITAQPTGALVVLGGAATFSVTGSLKAGAGATAPLTYQWRKNGVAIEGAVSPTYTIDATQQGDSGSYDVLLTSGLANAVSVAATLTVGLPVSITAGPADTTVKAGSSFELSVTPGGTGPFSYQWSKNGVNITKATSSKLTVASATLADAGRYEVSIRNQFGAYPANPSAQVVVKAPPVITKDPVGAQVKLGASATLNVTATGTAPLAYQWRRNGVALPGATLSSYTIPAATEESVGAYDVIVGNALGTAVSSRGTVLVNIPTVIVRQPAGASVQEGSVLSLSVLAKGTGTLRYQWYKWDKAGKLTNPGTQATLPLGAGGTVTPADAGTYVVTVSGYGPMVTSEQVVVEVRSGRGIAILEHPSDMELLKGTALTAFVRIDANGADVRETRYTLCRVSDKTVVPTSIVGIVPANGALEVPLRSFADSRAVVQFTRTYTDGTSATAQTQPFVLTQHSWEESAGTYEAVLLDMNSPASIGDGGISRGLMTLSVTKTGAISGRLLYVEAGSIAGAPNGGLRSYVPVTRSFSGTFTPSQGESTVLVAHPKLGVGTQAGRQELALELNIASTPPALKATVKDNASLQAPAFVLSRAENCTRSVGTLPSELAGLVGRYVLSANEALPSGSTARDNNGYVLAQVLASGKVLWSTRLTGYSGSGSAGLDTSNPLQIVAPFYESRLVAGGTLTTASALLGRLVWEPTLSQSWNVSIGAGTLANRLEKHASQLAGSRSGTAFVPVYEQAKFDTGANGASVQLLDFRDQIESGWGATPIAALFPVERALTLRVSDPLTQPATEFSWNVTVSSSGVVRSTGVANGGLTAPTLSLRLDQTRGEWLGSYVSGGIRRTLTGAALELPTERGRGWVEIGPNTGRWRLELAP